MKNRELADIFTRMADLLEILGEDSFRVVSYRKAAGVLEELTEPIEDFAAAGRLMEIPGIGKSIAEKIQQYLAVGRIDRYEELAAQAPPGLLDIMRLQGMGPKTASRLWREVGIGSIEQLRAVLDKEPERISSLKGMGEKKIQQMKESLAFVESTGGRILLGQADELADELLASMQKSPAAGRPTVAGSLRRGRETIGDIDIVCQAPPDKAGEVIEAFTRSPAVRKVLAAGGTKGSVLLDKGVQADLRVVEEKSFGSALAYLTGSKAHNVRLREMAIKQGMKLNEYGLFRGEKQITGSDEEGIYKALGMELIPPELREDRGEIEAALAGKLPKLLEPADIRGDMHMHTTASDGACTIGQMIDACRARGYKYMVISDHSVSQHVANGLDASRLADHVEAIRAAAARYKDIHVLAGTEVDILKDGSLDYDDEVLSQLDFVLASPHAALNMPRQEATERIIKAIQNPFVHAIGHPSGRLLNTRPGMEIDIEAIARAAAKHHVALEINAHYFRLDLRDTHVRTAIEAGAKIVINSDAHGLAELEMMKYGIITARRGWATKADVINAWAPGDLSKWLAKKK